jgi:dimethylargininase
MKFLLDEVSVASLRDLWSARIGDGRFVRRLQDLAHAAQIPIICRLEWNHPVRVFDFDHAILRRPGRSVVDGLRSEPAAAPDYEQILAEHAAYAVALRAEGLDVEILPPLEHYPDSMFVEDPALVFPEGAILLRSGAPSRRGESDAMREVLKRRFGDVLELGGNDEYVDGGDVLVTPDAVLIGLSGRTNAAGANALAARLGRFGRKARIVATPQGTLHFKTGVSLLDEETVLATARTAGSGIFDRFRVVVVPAGEEAAANALRVGDVVLLGACFPRSCDLAAKLGFAVRPLPVTEVAKLDAGLSCMSLRWRPGRRQAV